MISTSSAVNWRVTRSSSSRVKRAGSRVTPPLAPPNGSRMSAHFQVMPMASARTSSRFKAGW
jgi:hypothetical protein